MGLKWLMVSILHLLTHLRSYRSSPGDLSTYHTVRQLAPLFVVFPQTLFCRFKAEPTNEELPELLLLSLQNTNMRGDETHITHSTLLHHMRMKAARQPC